MAGPGGGAGDGIFGTATTTLTSSQQQLYRYLSAHRGGASYLFADQSWTGTASPGGSGTLYECGAGSGPHG